MRPTCYHSIPHMGELLKENIKLRLDTETLRALEQLADEGDRTVAAEMRRALRKHVADSESARQTA